MDLIRICGLEIDCIVGIRPFEREREQRIHLEIALGLDLAPAGRAGRIALTCDYDQIATEVIAMLRFRRYHLVEMATEELSAMLFSVHPAILHVHIRLDKPAALDGRARSASVEIERTRSAYPVTSTRAAHGSTDLVLETREAKVELVRIAQSAELVEVPEDSLRVLEWLVAGEVERSGTALESHTPVTRSPGDAPAKYVNRGRGEAVLFRCLCSAAHA